MSAPSEVHNFQSVKIRYTQRLATDVEQAIASCKVTNMMKPMGRTLQAATRVKVLSSEIFNIIEADTFHCVESEMNNDAMASHYLLYRSLRPWHVMRWKLCELGRSIIFSQEYVGTSYKRREQTEDVMEVGLTDSTWSTGKPYAWGSGQQCSNGLRGYMANPQRLETHAN